MENKKPLLQKINDFTKKESFKSILSSLISIGVGVLVGFLVMLVVSIFDSETTIFDAFYGLVVVLTGPFTGGSYVNVLFGNMIFYAVPLIFTGLSVAIANKTGLFNIGAAGQYTMGAIGALIIALNINTLGNRGLGILVWILAIIVGTLFGMIWGMIPGFLKAYFGINEVICCIMTNWIAAKIATLTFLNTNLHNDAANHSAYLINPGMLGNQTPQIGIFGNSLFDIGIFIAIIIAIFLKILLDKTTFGYELKACGANKNAAKYAGMNEKRNIILSMAIAGGLAAMGACFYYLNQGTEYPYLVAAKQLPDYGFNGIPAALLASNNPVGTIFSALFIRYTLMGGTLLSSAGYNQYIADIIIAIIIYLAGFSRLFRDLLDKKKKNDKKEKDKKEDLILPVDKEENKEVTTK